MGLREWLKPRIQDYAMRFMDELRAPTVGAAAGEVLEVGFGTARNLEHYGAKVVRVTGLDPMSTAGIEAVESRIARAAAASMAKTGGGSIVLIGTQAAFLPSTAQIAYGASKGALKTAMYYMAKELGPKKIRVNTVVPTWMWGPPVEAYVKMMAKQRGVSTDVVIGEITARMPLGEIPQDGDVAEAVVFFCSDRARMISGQYLMVNAAELMT